jgi:uncharacterized protein YecT (DUF1311 family)
MSAKTVMGCLLSLAMNGAFAQSIPAQGSRAEAGQNCLAIGEIAAKEKCFATSEDFKECPETDRRCAPYKKMYALEKKLEQLSEDLLSSSQNKYASYRESDPTYLQDLAKYLTESNSAWRSQRDADCLFEQYAQGMARQEIPDLVEACRVERTSERIRELGNLMDAQR